jgi:REP-associated tyrosine transposase
VFGRQGRRPLPEGKDAAPEFVLSSMVRTFYQTWGKGRSSLLRLPEYPALPVHVTLSTHRRLPVFARPAVALNVYLLLREHPQTLAAVLMPDHLHWLVRDASDLPTIVRRFKSHSTQRAWTAGHSGRLWQRSFFDALIRDRDMVVVTARYDLANPVRAGLAATWQEYPWAFLHPSLGG